MPPQLGSPISGDLQLSKGRYVMHRLLDSLRLSGTLSGLNSKDLVGHLNSPCHYEPQHPAKY